MPSVNRLVHRTDLLKCDMLSSLSHKLQFSRINYFDEIHSKVNNCCPEMNFTFLMYCSSLKIIIILNMGGIGISDDSRNG